MENTSQGFIINFLTQKYGYNSDVRANIDIKLPIWRQFDKGSIDNFHNYQDFNGLKMITMHRKTLKFARKVAQDKADLQFNEKTKIELKDEAGTQELNDILTKNDFWLNTAEDLADMFAFGLIAWVVRVEDVKIAEDSGEVVGGGKVYIDSVATEDIYPLTYNRAEGITECAFKTQRYEGGKIYYYLSVHTKDETGNYVIQNHKFNESGTEQTAESYEFNTGSNIPWFATPHTIKRMERTDAFYNSCFSEALEEIKALDVAFTQACTEINLSGRHNFYDIDVLKEESSGEYQTQAGDRLVPMDGVYYLNNGASATGMIQSVATQLRNTAFWEEIKNLIATIGTKVGLGKTYDPFGLRMSNVSFETVEASISESLIRRDTDWLPIESALHDLMTAVIYASNTYCGTRMNAEGLSIQQDDSIFRSQTRIENKAQSMLNMGLWTRAEALAYIEQLDDVTAEKRIEAVDEERANREAQSIQRAMETGMSDLYGG